MVLLCTYFSGKDLHIEAGRRLGRFRDGRSLVDIRQLLQVSLPWFENSNWYIIITIP
jgi:hypothetical protein